MCGIAGIIGATSKTVAEVQVRDMIAGLTHRGPDGTRVEILGAGVVAHARLSIIDLEGGWQPLHAAGGSVIGNGEIYNYLELAQDHGLDGALKTGSDFEPLLHLYAKEGVAAFQRLRGMYGLCLIGADGRVFLVRDPYGIKPLYVRQMDPGVAFASEARVLPRSSWAAPTTELAEEVLTLGYRVSPPPYGVQSLDPGEIAEVVDGKLMRHVGAIPRVPSPAPRPRSQGDALSRLDAVLEDAVAVHQRSDVPYGLFLSGGVDSSIIATLMSRLNARPVTAFTCGFDAPEAADERGKAERVARALDLDWREVKFGAEDFWRIAPLIASALDDPTTDYACLPTYHLAEAARGTLTVVLSGEGGDELFAGYGRYRRALRPGWLGGRPAEPRAKAPFLADQGEGAVTRWKRAARNSAPTLLQQSQEADIATWLPNDLLLKLDRCLMAHGLEGRTPFLDREVADFAASLPDGMKVKGRLGKWILRLWLEKHCPVAEPFAKKQGFTVPVASWIAPLAGQMGPRIAAVEGLRKVCQRGKVEAVFADETQAAQRWPLMFYALWWLINFGGATPDEAMAEIGGPTAR
jgi:asparagine synthase (glutamine-hydrolysing)